MHASSEAQVIMDKSWHINLHPGPFYVSGESLLSAYVHDRAERPVRISG